MLSTGDQPTLGTLKGSIALAMYILGVTQPGCPGKHEYALCLPPLLFSGRGTANFPGVSLNVFVGTGGDEMSIERHRAAMRFHRLAGIEPPVLDRSLAKSPLG